MEATQLKVCSDIEILAMVLSARSQSFPARTTSCTRKQSIMLVRLALASMQAGIQAATTLRCHWQGKWKGRACWRQSRCDGKAQQIRLPPGRTFRVHGCKRFEAGHPCGTPTACASGLSRHTRYSSNERLITKTSNQGSATKRRGREVQSENQSFFMQTESLAATNRTALVAYIPLGRGL